jgi:hypothetical protein
MHVCASKTPEERKIKKRSLTNSLTKDQIFFLSPCTGCGTIGGFRTFAVNPAMGGSSRTHYVVGGVEGGVRKPAGKMGGRMAR